MSRKLVAGESGDDLRVTLEQDGDDVDIQINGVTVAYFTLNNDDEAELSLKYLALMEDELEGIAIVRNKLVVSK